MLIFILALSLGTISFAKNSANRLENSKFTIVDIKEPVGNPNAKYIFIDENMKNHTSTGISIMGASREVYDHSYYIVGSKTLKDYNVGPIKNRIFLISVARGQTVFLEEEKSVSGTVTYSGTVEAEIKRVINLNFTSSISGTYTRTWKKGVSFEGPDSSSPYNSRDFYGAIDYDLYNVKVDRYDVYKIYNGNIDTEKTVTYYNSSKYINNVKKPKGIQYSLDYNRD